jgi:serine/threonine protein kinase
MLTCPYCQHQNSNQVTQCVSCGSSLGSDVLPTGTLLFGNTLEVQSVLGRGGFGIVYKALHLEKQRYVAIKELFPEGLASRGYNKQVSISSQLQMQAAIARTSREAAMLRKLKHPSAIKLFAYWEENNTAYMAMELLEGETLEKRIGNKQLLSAEEAKQALLTILEVLEELHSHGFLHRDIKPANIMFTPARVELIDFGSLTEFSKGQRTKVSSRIATLEYAPLEQFGSEVTLSPATDLYALAATFCEAMTGSRVPSALDRANGASLEPSMIAVRRVSRELGDILEKALELRMEFRFADVNSIFSALYQNSVSSGIALHSSRVVQFQLVREYSPLQRILIAFCYFAINLVIFSGLFSFSLQTLSMVLQFYGIYLIPLMIVYYFVTPKIALKDSLNEFINQGVSYIYSVLILIGVFYASIFITAIVSSFK